MSFKLQTRFAVESLKFTLSKCRPSGPIGRSEIVPECFKAFHFATSRLDLFLQSFNSLIYFAVLETLLRIDGLLLDTTKSLLPHRRTTQHGWRLFFPAAASTSTKASSAKSAISIGF